MATIDQLMLEYLDRRLQVIGDISSTSLRTEAFRQGEAAALRQARAALMSFQSAVIDSTPAPAAAPAAPGGWSGSYK